MMGEFMDALKGRARRYVIGLGVGAVVVAGTLAIHTTAEATGALPLDHVAAAGAAPQGAVRQGAAPESLKVRRASRPASAGAGTTGERTQGPSLAGPPITASRDAALRVTAATNVHTAAMTDPEASAATTASTVSRTVAGSRAASATGEGAGRGPVTTAGGTPAAPAQASTGTGRPRGQSVSVTVGAAGAEQPGEVAFVRETFGYAHGGRRDPFVSLMANGELRPMIADLRLVAVAYDPNGRNSVAIMRDVSTKEQYRVKVGQTLGRMRAARIQPKEVVFTIEEFGLSRQAVLTLSDSTTARTK